MSDSSRGGRGLAGLITVCALVVTLLMGARLVAARSPRAEELTTSPAGRTIHDDESSFAVAEPIPVREEREELVASSASDGPPAEAATATITGRLQINGFAARRGRVRVRTADGSFDLELVVDPYGRFYVEGVPAGELLLGFQAEGLFERQLVLPDQYSIEAGAGELEVVDLDWWTRHVNVFIGGEEGDLRAAQVELSGPGYTRLLEVDEGGIARLDLIGQGIFMFRARTRDGREDSATLELESGDELDTVALTPRVKKS